MQNYIKFINEYLYLIETFTDLNERNKSFYHIRISCKETMVKFLDDLVKIDVFCYNLKDVLNKRSQLDFKNESDKL